CADRPGHAQWLNALSECYARTGSLSPKARDVYLKSLDVSPRRPELKFLIGRSFLAERNFQEAARFLTEAIVEGFQDEAVFLALSDAYRELHRLDADVLPILERVRASRTTDARFLAYLCEVYRANGRCDAPALQCAQQTLALDPSCRPAHLLYAQILLIHGQVEGAWRRVAPLLEAEPDAPDVLQLAARCLIAQDRRDDETVRLLEKALVVAPDDAQILAHLAHIFFMRGWFDPHTAEVYQRAAELNPNDDRIVEALARMAEKDNRREDLARHLERLVALGRSSRDLMLRLADVYCALGVADERARKPYETALQDNPDNRDILAALGRVYLAAKDTSPAAIAVLTRLRESGIALPGLERHLITALDRNHQFQPLIALCDVYLSTHDDPEVRRIRAHAFLMTGQTDQAIAEFEPLFARHPNNPAVVTDLAMAYAAAGRSDETAISLYGRALRIAPNLDVLYRALGCALARRGNLADAVAQFRTALRVRKDCAAALADQCAALLEEDASRTPLRWFLCELLINCGRFREAIDHLCHLMEREPEKQEQICEALGHILEADPENVYARSVRGSILMRAGRLAEARGDLEVANRLQPGNRQTLENLRRVYEALLAENEDAEIRLRLGMIYRDSGDSDSALRSFQKSVRDYRFEAESIRQMGKVFMQKNMLDLALEEFQKLPMDDDLKETVYQLGQMYEQRGDIAGARNAYRLIYASDAGFRDVQQRYETLSGEGVGAADRAAGIERTLILNQLSEKAKQRYKLLEEVGRGAMGIVYRAMDSELDEVVALKILPDNLSNNNDALARFRREARSARRLSHRNIVRIHDIGEEMGRKYISMEFVEGTTLKALIRASGGGLELPRVIKYGCQILDALAYAHSIGIVHRDIKPANIMITRDDEVKVTDFGIAKILESADATAEGAVVGTPLYMSPEQVRGEPVDHRADIYSLGILLYECIEGKPPFLKGDLAYSHLHVWPEPMTRGFSELNRIIMRALEKRKEDRWPTAQAMLDAMRALSIPT
ncbi:MAG: protein kinase, partial [Candidatus Sumerlaeia bacterium]|nr:protein kinase [Candidatus Sumerlaeia bacterium]